MRLRLSAGPIKVDLTIEIADVFGFSNEPFSETIDDTNVSRLDRRPLL